MTVQSEASRNNYLGNGTTDTYSYGFRIFAATDLLVTKADTAGVETQLVYLTDYTVAGVGSFNGGTITLLAGNLPSGYRITIRFRTTLTQGTDLRNQGSYFPETIEDALDRLTRQNQQQQDELNRGLRLPETEAGTEAARTLPTLAQRLSKFSAWDASGNPMASPGPSGVPTSAFMATVLDDATATDARTTLQVNQTNLGISAFVQTITDDGNSNAVLDTLTVTRSEAGATAVSLRTLLTSGAAVNVFAFMTAAQITDVVTGATTLNVTTAVQAAIDTNLSVYFPPGRYLVTALVLDSANSQRLFGAGYGDKDTFIVAADATSDVITVNAGQVHISHMQFISSVTRTAGAFVKFAEANNTLEYFRMTGPRVGVHITSSSCRVRYGEIGSVVVTTGVGILVEGNSYNLTLEKVDIGTSGLMDAAVSVSACSDLQIMSCQLLNAVTGLKIVPGLNQVAASVILNDTFCDTCTYGLYIKPTSNGSAVRFRATASWFNGSAYGVLIDKSTTTGVASGFAFVGGEVIGGTNDGMLFNAKDLQINGGKYVNATGSGLHIYSGADEVAVTGATFGPAGDLPANATGITVDLGAVNYMLVGNKVRGNSAAQITDNGGAVNKLVANNLVT